MGTVNTDALRLRNEASTSATVLGTASKGDTVVVLEMCIRDRGRIRPATQQAAP